MFESFVVGVLAYVVFFGMLSSVAPGISVAGSMYLLLPDWIHRMCGAMDGKTSLDGDHNEEDSLET